MACSAANKGRVINRAYQGSFGHTLKKSLVSPVSNLQRPNPGMAIRRSTGFVNVSLFRGQIATCKQCKQASHAPTHNSRHMHMQQQRQPTQHDLSIPPFSSPTRYFGRVFYPAPSNAQPFLSLSHTPIHPSKQSISTTSTKQNIQDPVKATQKRNEIVLLVVKSAYTAQNKNDGETKRSEAK